VPIGKGRDRDRGWRVLLLLLSPLWAPFFLLVQAMLLCGDGLIQLLEEAWAARSG